MITKRIWNVKLKKQVEIKRKYYKKREQAKK